MGLRRCFRFSLRTLLIVATLCCVALAFVIEPARRHRQTVLELQRRGAFVCYVSELTADDRYQKSPPAWSQRWMGCDFGQPVSIVNYPHSSAFTEEDWRLIEICQPRSLTIEAKEQGDRDVVRAARLGSITRLNISNPSITANGLLHLQKMPQLEDLKLAALPLTEESLLQIASLRQLRRLGLSHSPICDSGIMRLAQMHELRSLWLWEVQGILRYDIDKLRAVLPNCMISSYPG